MVLQNIKIVFGGQTGVDQGALEAASDSDATRPSRLQPKSSRECYGAKNVLK